MVGLVSRMRLHLAKRCTECPASVRADMAAGDDGTKKAVTTSLFGSLDQVPTAIKMPVNNTNANDLKIKKRKVMMPEVPPSNVDKLDIQNLVSKAIYGAGLPVSVIEDPSFQRLLKRLSPTYQSCTVSALASNQLNAEFMEIQARIRGDINDAPSVCLGVESWSLMWNRSILSHIVYAPNPAVYSFEGTRENVHSTEMLFQRMEAVLLSIGLEKVSTLVVDNSPSMRDASELLVAKYQHLTILPSCSHAFDAMMTELLRLPAFHGLWTVCRDVTAFFSQNHLHKARFARVASELNIEEIPFGLVDADPSRPASIVACVNAMDKYRHVFDVLLAEDFGALNTLDMTLREKLSNLSWWGNVAQFKSILAPFGDIFDVFDADFASLAMFYHKFTQLWSHLQHPSISPDVTRIVNKHWATMRHPAMYTAYLLDPRFLPSSLGNEETNEALSFLKQLSTPALFANLISELTRYTGRCTGVFADEAVWESAKHTPPIHWWKGFLGSSCPHLQSVALRVLCFPATAGLSHAKRSQVDTIQAANAKWMNDEQLNKAAYVYLNMNMTPDGKTTPLAYTSKPISI
ncbi:hypothetical protein Ae201684P_009943 [Aphanomyces euteiches]|uniref:DUF659 domain-containing protein n=1 Tax=Aphanomyces euteiches TaxID=100861 RepID=A0A6G0XG68_9STRA|nr:hypothetical protein Ae201684_005061 [Aphanomyces euteiches]KAH9082620.1 hypothetical protein Ae201684P_009943 [Aphanomyces euteiches]KAH9145825.1 hypothetical protein AeRB84_010282 [Aphanomyces euteiches]